MLTRGRTLDGRYTIIEEIGSGGFGAVYLAQDTRFSGNNRIAIKKIPQSSAQIAESFRREADLLYNLSHPNLPKVTNCFQEDGANYIVMDYISGEDLAESLGKGKRFSIAEVLEIADKVLDALEYLHSATIFHRDIKPHNIKIDTKGKIFLLDFGTAKGNFDETTLTRQAGQSISGYTPFYAPLEQVLRVDSNSYFLLQSLGSPKMEDFLNKKTDARSDIYSLGATLYHLLTRQSPEKATSTIRAHAIWSDKPDTLQPIQNLNAEISDGLAEIIHRSVEIEPEKRFQTAAEFRRALNNLQNENMSSETVVLPDSSTSFSKTQPAPPSVKFSTFENSDPIPTNLDFTKNLTKRAEPKSKTALYVGVLIMFFILGSAGIFLAWKLSAEPVKTISRSLSYSLLVQKMRDGVEYQEPFQSSGQEIFENGYKFQMRFTPPDIGFFYVFAEGLNNNNEKVLKLIFPTPLRNNGKAEISANRLYETGWNQFGGTAGTENFWIIWSKDKPDIVEKSRNNAFQSDKEGELTDKGLADQLRNYLEKNKTDQATVSKDSEKKLTKVEFNGDSIVYLIQLEHR
jgi:serine/threonine protein kinase